MNTDDLDKIEVPAGLESKLEVLIDNLDKKENQLKRKVKQIRLRTISIAASVALFISAGLFFIHSNNEDQSPITAQTVDTITDPAMAYQEAKKALELVSRNFNKGINQLAMATNKIEKSNKTLNKTLKR
jgi:hypothetical protein